jgi:hypothetical protein
MQKVDYFYLTPKKTEESERISINHAHGMQKGDYFPLTPKKNRRIIENKQQSCAWYAKSGLFTEKEPKNYRE